MELKETSTRIIRPGDGTPLPGGFAVVIKVRSEATGGVMSVIEETLPAKRLITPHVHENDVWVYVLQGEIGALVGEEIVMAGPATWVLKPRGILHAMWNPGLGPARLIEVLTPGGSERWFEEVSSLDPGDRAAIDASCARYGVRFIEDSPWTQELRRRYGLLS
jgi:mannose-6-phosphate isomerase-like protein (cupin superfamily)